MPARISSKLWRPQPQRDALAIDAVGELTGRRVVVMGLGRFGGGIGAARWLASRGARVVVTDVADRASLASSIDRIADLDIEYDLGGHTGAMLDGASLVVVSPAVPKDRSAFFGEVVARRIPWTTEINLFLARCPATVVGVTGSAGKSTTSAMIDVGISAAMTDGTCYLGGNIGRSLLSEVDRMSDSDIVVLELSSFQLADLPRISRRPDLAVIVSLFPHHVERHGSYDAYIDSKLNIVRGAPAGTPVVVGFDDEAGVSRIRALTDAMGGDLIRADEASAVDGLKLPGVHNAMNARCAATVCRLLGLDEDRVRGALRDFSGLPHRMELVGQHGGVRFYNDSKATCPTTAAAALRSFDGAVVALVGGKARDVRLDTLVEAIRQSARSVIFFGGGGAMVADAIQKECQDDPATAMVVTSTFGEGVRAACEIARSGDAVVLAPGFESYDEFPNYEHRGRAFVEIVGRCASRD